MANNQSRDTKLLATGAILGAAAVVLMLASCVMPTMQLTVIAAAGILSAAMLIEGGLKWALLMYGAVSILSALLLPDKSSAVFYILFFGHYPIIKYEIERIRKIWLSWVVKLAAGGVCTVLIIWILSAFFPEWEFDYAKGIIGLMCMAVFVLFDVALTRLLGWYQFRIRPKLYRRR